MAAPVPLPLDDPSLSLALAMVCSSPTPLLLLDGDARVLAASASFCAAFNIDPARVVGQTLFDLGAGEWDLPQLRGLVEATTLGEAEVDSYEMTLLPPDAASKTLILIVRKIRYDQPEHARLIIAVSDVTQAREAAKRDGEVARDYALLLQETRHRIANSLQIIASVMMLNARRTSSEETRGHLRDAHARVLSIADLQEQLAQSSKGDVAIRAYLVRLCDTISASMIADPQRLSIHVEAPDVRIAAEVSVSLGLIVTELVINALKHAFPNGASGAINVVFTLNDPGWSLEVSDTGVGIPKDAEPKPIAGLGSSIVQALSRQLGATVLLADAAPGTRVFVVKAAVQPGDLPSDAQPLVAA